MAEVIKIRVYPQVSNTHVKRMASGSPVFYRHSPGGFHHVGLYNVDSFDLILKKNVNQTVVVIRTTETILHSYV